MPNSHERSEDAVAPHQGRPCLQWVLVAVETLLFFASLAFIVTLNVWVLAVWLFLGTLYVLGGLAAVWSGEKLQLEDLTGDKGDGTKQLRSMSSWFVVPPMLAAAMGAVTAIAALLCDTPGTGAPKEPALVIAPALGGDSVLGAASCRLCTNVSSTTLHEGGGTSFSRRYDYLCAEFSVILLRAGHIFRNRGC